MGLRGYKTGYYRDGEFIESMEIDRGSMLVLDERVWRNRDTMSNIRKWALFASLYVAFMTLVAIFLYYLGSSAQDTFMIRFALFLQVTIVVLPIAGMFNRIHNLNHSPAVGLYENGFQLTYWLFIPYSEMTKVERVRVKSREPDFLDITIKVPTHRDQLRYPISYFTEEGVEEIERRVEEASWHPIDDA